MEQQQIEETAQENKVLAALGYPIWLVALVVVLTDLKKDPFLRYHAWQALFYGIAWIIVWVALSFLAAILLILPVVGLALGSLLTRVSLLVWLVLSIVLAYKAYQGERFTLPLISDYSRRYGDDQGEKPRDEQGQREN